MITQSLRGIGTMLPIRYRRNVGEEWVGVVGGLIPCGWNGLRRRLSLNPLLLFAKFIMTFWNSFTLLAFILSTCQILCGVFRFIQSPPPQEDCPCIKSREQLYNNLHSSLPQRRSRLNRDQSFLYDYNTLLVFIHYILLRFLLNKKLKRNIRHNNGKMMSKHIYMRILFNANVSINVISLH